MTALYDFAAAVRSLLDGAGSIGPDADPIVLPGKGDAPPSLLLRSRTGSEPRAFELSPAGEVQRILPHADRSLPGTEWLVAGLLPELLQETRKRMGQVRVRAYRPRRRLVLSIARPGLPNLYLKLFTASGHRRATQRLAAIGPAPSRLDLCLPRHSLPDAAALCFEAAPGENLHDAVWRGEDVALEPLLDALEAGRRVPVLGHVPRVGLQEAKKSAISMVGHARALVPELGELYDRLESWCPEVTADRAWQHGDLHDKQIFLADGMVHWIDLDGSGVGDGLQDAANLAEHLRLRSLQAEARNGESLAESLVRAVADRFGEKPRTVAAWRMATRARLAGVYGLRPRWHDLSRRLAREASEMLEQAS